MTAATGLERRTGAFAPSRSALRLALACAIAAILVNVGSLRNGFAFDDVPAVLGDPRVVEAELPPTLVIEPYWSAHGEELGIWRPLVTVSYAIDWLASDGSTMAFHLTNLLWHGAAVLLATLLLAAFFEPVAAAVGGLLFAVHPVHVEAVANVVGRSEPMAAVAVFAAMLVWLRGGRAAVPVVALCYALGLLAKESAVMLPALLVLVDFARGRWQATADSMKRYLREYAVAYALLALVLVVYLVARWQVLDGAAPTTPHPAAEGTDGAVDLLRTALQVWPQYARLLLFPVTLLADYSPGVLLPLHEWTAASVLGLTVLIALVGGGAIALRRGHRRTALGLLWMPIALLPVSNLVITIGTLLAERLLYLPSFALSIGVAAAWSAATTDRLRHNAALALRVALIGIVVLMAVRSVQRVPEWRSTATIFAALERDAPESYRAKWYHARVAREQGEPARASSLYEQAIELWPYRTGLLLEAAGHEVARDRLPLARALAGRAVALDEDNLAALRLFVALSLDVGDTATARRALQRGLTRWPEDSMLRSMNEALP